MLLVVAAIGVLGLSIFVFHAGFSAPDPDPVIWHAKPYLD